MTEHGHKYVKITVEKADGSILTFDITDPSTEPVFLLRGQDKYAARAVDYYSYLLQVAGLEDQAAHAMEHAAYMRHWPHQKQPD